MGLNGGLGTELGYEGRGPEAQRDRYARGGGWKGPGFAQQQASPPSNLGAVT